MLQYSYIIMERLANLPPAALHQRLVFLKECGYAGVEVNLTEPAGIDLDQFANWLAELGLVVPAFLTGEAYTDGLCLSSPDPSIRQQTVARLTSYLETAQRFGALLVVGLLQGSRQDEPDPQQANERIAEGLQQVAEAAAARGVEIVIEPVNHLQVGFNNSVGEVLALIDRIGLPVIRPMVDTVHMNIEETSLTRPIIACGRRLRHVHLCESNGGRFGSGRVTFPDVLQTLQQIDYQGFASIKVYRHLDFEEAARSSLAYLHQIAEP